MLRALPYVLALVFSVLCGCSAGRGAVRLDGAMPSPVRDTANQERLRTLLVHRQSPEDSSEYRISLGDLLSVTIHSYRPGGGDFLTDVRVDEAGKISLPMIPTVQASGLTIADFREALAGALQRAEVIRQPMITVSLKEYLGRQVVVLGAVARPGRYTLSRGQEELIDILSMAGGLSPTAGNYLILRPKQNNSNGSDVSNLQVAYTLAAGGAGELPRLGSDDSIVLPLGTGKAGADSSLATLPVRGGDIIMIPEAGQAFLEGKVDKPGVYQLRHGMTLSQLLANAGNDLPRQARQDRTRSQHPVRRVIPVADRPGSDSRSGTQRCAPRTQRSRGGSSQRDQDGAVGSLSSCPVNRASQCRRGFERFLAGFLNPSDASTGPAWM